MRNVEFFQGDAKKQQVRVAVDETWKHELAVEVHDLCTWLGEVFDFEVAFTVGGFAMQKMMSLLKRRTVDGAGVGRSVHAFCDPATCFGWEMCRGRYHEKIMSSL